MKRDLHWIKMDLLQIPPKVNPKAILQPMFLPSRWPRCLGNLRMILDSFTFSDEVQDADGISSDGFAEVRS